MHAIVRVRRRETGSLESSGGGAVAPLRAAAAALVLVAATVAGEARAHEVLHDVVRGGAVAVHVYESDGEALADAPVEVYSPRDPRTPYQRARTDRNGWASFVPDAPGSWRVRVFGEDGHGLDLRVEVDRAHVRSEAGQGVAIAAPGLKFILRPVAGVLAIVAVFVALFIWRRRTGAGRSA